MHEFGFTEEMLKTRTIENMKEKQESHEKLSHTKKGRNENDIIKLSTKTTYLEKKILDCETMFEQFRDAISNTVNEEDNIKNVVQILYNKGLFDNFPSKNQAIESYSKINED